MEAKTLQALENSIAHWERMRDGGESEKPVADDCALCQLFHPNHKRGRKLPSDCKGCPVFENTGKQYCDGTPYSDAADAWFDEGDFYDGYFPKAAQKMIDYLKSLLPTTEQEGCGE